MIRLGLGNLLEGLDCVLCIRFLVEGGRGSCWVSVSLRCGKSECKRRAEKWLASKDIEVGGELIRSRLLYLRRDGTERRGDRADDAVKSSD